MPIILEKHGGIAVITLNAPPLNLQTLRSMELLERIVIGLRHDAETRCVVITAAGDRVFCAGSDVKEFPELRGNFVEEKLRRENAVFSRINELPMPVVAALNGAAMGGGAELALCCDFRIMSETAKIGFPEINLGNFPGSGGPFRLSGAISGYRAFELMSLATVLSAEEALNLGLVWRVAPQGEVLPRALELASGLCSKDPEALRRIKALVRAAHRLSAEEAADLSMKFAEELIDLKNQ